MTEFEQMLAWLHAFPRVAPSEDLGRMRRLASYAGDPQHAFAGRIIHVAGTNGKGSACAFLAASLQAAGYRTGLYISPFIHHFTERIEINGEPVDEARLLSYKQVLESAAARLLRETGETPAEFELLTLLCFLVFRDADCGAVVLETGLGGRLDATNLCDPAVCVIMHIARDHTELLGDTLPLIAAEKAGILKPGREAVFYPVQDGDAMATLQDTANARECPVTVPDCSKIELTSLSCDGGAFRYDGVDYTVRLPGEHQVYNAVTAVEALHAFARCGFSVSPAAIGQGLASARFPARFETLCRAPRVIFDGAHNKDGLTALHRTLSLCMPGALSVGVCGMLRDKDPEAALLPILRDNPFQIVYCTEPQSPRAMPADALAAVFCAAGIEAVACPDIAQAVKAAMAAARAATPDTAVIAFGSLYLADGVTRAVRALQSPSARPRTAEQTGSAS